MKIYTSDVASTDEGMVLSCSSFEDTPVLKGYDSSMNKTKIVVSSKVNGMLQKLSRAIDTKKLFAPSTIGVIVGFIIGATPQLKKAMIGENAPLRMARDSFTLLGNGTIPSLILITGGNLIKGFNGPGIKISIIAGIIVVRFIALPIIGTTFIQFAVHFGLVHSDPLYHLVLYLQNAVPPAMNIASMIQMFDAGEGELSVIFLWSYIAASVGLTLWSMLFLWLVS
ncbi:protein PIN-LIKES 7-like [Phalaenopsis equestris]|uniref:protein PIN-LIKES 7-like n=1 Tax=Phalaenopsis equestris TaxID=78828 RepID=UPI0009E5BF05|nr:protein PIN-LIKES 7-like [Phalaenopsis equestris]